MAREIINGVPNQYGAPLEPSGLPTKMSGVGSPEKVMVVDFKYDNLPSGSTTDAGIFQIPQGSFIVSAHLEVLTAFAGGTSYDIGLVRATDGTTAISAAGLFSAVALASINAQGKWAVGAGALVGAVSDVTYAGQIKATATGTFTAGRAKLYVTYIPSSQFA